MRQLKIPQKVGKWTSTSLFVTYAGVRCHAWVRVGRESIAIATRSQNQSRTPLSAAEDFVNILPPPGAQVKKMVDMVCQHLGQDAIVALPTRLQQLTESTVVAPWALRLETKDIYLSSKLMSERGVECHRQGPYDGAQRFLWHLSVEQALKVAHVPARWATVAANTDDKQPALRPACAE